MDNARFDRLTRAFATGLSRRGALGGLLAAAVPVSLAVEDAGADGDYRFCKKSAAVAGADLHQCNYKKAKFAGRDLHGADLRSANLRKANLKNANLRGVDFSVYGMASGGTGTGTGADLTGAKLDGADVTDANFDGAIAPDGKRCSSGQVVCYGTCVPGNACCGANGIDNSKQGCCENPFIGTGSTVPYDLSTDTCCGGSVVSGNACCGLLGYDSSSQQCCGLEVCGGTSGCCGLECPCGTTGECCENYDPPSCELVCVTCGTPSPGDDACCGLIPYNSSTQMCCAGVVGNGDACCGSTAHDSATSFCCGAEIGNYSDQQCCGAQVCGGTSGCCGGECPCGHGKVCCDYSGSKTCELTCI